MRSSHASRIEIVQLRAVSVIQRLPKALEALGLHQAAKDGDVWVASPEQVEQDTGAPGWECPILRKDESSGRETEVGVLLVQPLSTCRNSQTYLEFPGNNLLGPDFGAKLEQLLTRHQKPHQARVKRANQKCAELAFSPVRTPAPNNEHGTSRLALAPHLSSRSRRTARRIVARAHARHTPILSPFKRRTCADLGAEKVDMAPTMSSLNAARYNKHSQHAWSHTLLGNYVEERERAASAPGLNFPPWGNEIQAVDANANPHDPVWDQAGGNKDNTTASRVNSSYARGNRRPDVHDTRYLTATAIDVPLQPGAKGIGEGYQLRRNGWPQQKQPLDPRAAPAGAYTRPRAGGGSGPAAASTAAGDPWHGRVESFELERLAQKHFTIVQHLQWPAPSSAVIPAGAATANGVELTTTE